jgi:hypothetical protein
MDNTKIDVEIDTNPSTQTFDKKRVYTCGVSPHIYQKLEKHLFLLKTVDTKRTRKTWILEAIQEKLANETINDDIPKQKRVSVEIDESTHQQLDQRVNLMKKFHTTYSKKQWILDAILEKLDKDNKKISEKLTKIKDDCNKNS